MSRLEQLLELLGIEGLPGQVEEMVYPDEHETRVNEKIELVPVAKAIKRTLPTLNTSADVKKHITYIKSEVEKFEVQYHQLPLQQRRDIRLPHAEARFICAAVFQHKPSVHAHDYFLSSDRDLLVEANADEPSAEICPTTDYYVHAALREADDSLKAGDLEGAEQHLRDATTQLDEIENMLLQISKSSSGDLPIQDDWQVLLDWNEAGYYVQRGVVLELAIERALRKASTLQGGWDNDHTKDNGGRQYFLWHPEHSTKVAKPMYPANLPDVNDIPWPRYSPTPEEWEALLAEYKSLWSTLSPHDNKFPSPLDFMTDIEHEHEFQHTDMPSFLKIQTFFLRGAGFQSAYFHKHLAHECKKGQLPGDIQIGLDEDPVELADLEKYLSKTEIPRWHSDRINRRTGVPGEVDQTISQREDIRVVWNALQELRDILREGKFVHAEKVNSRFEVERKKYKRTLRSEQERERAHREIRERWDREIAEGEAETMRREMEKEKDECKGEERDDEIGEQVEEQLDWVDDVE